ncbi:YaaA family protein [Ruicaihuangia caeni]|uniref:YaaA family protein n=1 Tax=Ruicaihuangia caeni TaxID=3042517 RepID=UPI00338E076E
MLLLLPPSETKRDGGEAGTRLAVDSLAFGALSPERTAVIEALVRLCADDEAAIAALKLGPKQRDEVERNRRLTEAPLLAAMDRYTGVLYDALDASSLDAEQRRFAGRHIAIHSALFGPLSALDAIPPYRLSHDSRLPGMPLKRHWRAAVGQALSEAHGLVLDLRSEAYTALGPAPDGSYFVRVVTEDADGRRRALNHFNKQAKGQFVRSIIEAGIEHTGADSLLSWAADAGIRIGHGAPGELELVV